ncbi:MAG: GNAT family N-acetyltransferase [Nocardioidaceae bacterium]
MTISLRALHADDLDVDAHYQRVRSDPDNTNRAIEEDGALAGMIASFTVDGDREVTYWIDRARWGRGIASAAVQTFLTRESQRPLFARAAAHNLGSTRCSYAMGW